MTLKYSLAAMLQSLLCFQKNKSALTKKLILVLITIVCISSLHAQTLVAYYPLNGNTKDSSGNHYDGTIGGAVSSATDRNGKANRAGNFNGVDGRIDVPDKPVFRPTSFTASVWFYLDKTPSRYKILVGKNLCDGVLESFALYINLNGYLSGTISDGGANSVYVDYPQPSLYTWHLATMSYDYTHDSLKLYLDGKVVDEKNVHVKIAYDNNSFAIGYQLENCVNDYFFHGRIDEVRYYNGALTDKQVSDLYDSTKIIQKPATLIAYYPLNGNAKDSSGNHFDGTISGKVSFATDINGKANRAGNFNGVDGRIDVPDNNLLKPIDFTVSAWFYLDKSPNRYKNIVTKNLCNGRIESFALQITPSNHIEGTASDEYTSIGVDGPVPSLYTWHLATMTFSQTRDSVKFYFDGVLTSVLKTSLNIEYDYSSLSIGDELENCANNYFFHGRIDEVRLYNGTLTYKQVSDLYNSTSHQAQFKSLNTASSAEDENSAATCKRLFSVSVFPNPVSALLNIYINNPLKEFINSKNELNINATSINLNKATLQVIGIAGNVVVSKQVDAFNKQNVIQQNVSQLAAGAYFVKLISADGREVSVVKFEKQ